jgi:hypothetical protein
MNWRSWLLFGPLVFCLIDAYLILKQIPVLSLSWGLEVVALAFLAGIYYVARRQNSVNTLFLNNVLLLFLANFAFKMYLQHH